MFPWLEFFFFEAYSKALGLGLGTSHGSWHAQFAFGGSVDQYDRRVSFSNVFSFEPSLLPPCQCPPLKFTFVTFFSPRVYMRQSFTCRWPVLHLLYYIVYIYISSIYLLISFSQFFFIFLEARSLSGHEDNPHADI